MEEPFTRLEMLIGVENLNKLKNSKVLILGIGGVGSYVVEALVRSGVGHIVLCDNDTIALSNINRQIHALPSTVNQLKVEVMRDRALAINPEVVVEIHPYLYNEQSAHNIIGDDTDYVVDAIDMVSSKLHLVEYCSKQKIPLIASMGTGNKLSPTMLEVTDIFKTSVCPVARVMRKELRKRGIKNLKVVYSKEEPLQPIVMESVSANANGYKRRSTPGSTSFVPSAAGLIIASEVVKALIH